MPEAIAVQQRIVPGAPPPAPLSKTQKKRRSKAKAKTGGNGTDGNNIDNIDRAESPATSVPDTGAATLVDKAPDVTDVQKGFLAPEHPAQLEPQTPTIPDELKPNTISGLVNKRLKVTTKKIVKITAYTATDPELLDDDQKRTLKNLPMLEAVQKELSEVKKAIEVYEADLAHELIAKNSETEKAQKAKMAEAVAASQNDSVQKVADILGLLRLRSHLVAGEVDTLSIDEHESAALLAVTDTLLSSDHEKRVCFVRDLLLGAGDVNGISYERLTEIVQLDLALPRAPSPITEPAVEEPEAETEVEAEAEGEPEIAPAVAITGAPGVALVSQGFSFVQESEIEEAQPADEDGWVDAEVNPQAPEEELTDAQQEVLTEVHKTAVSVFVEPATSAPLDWATDDTDLPPIADVQESMGASGSATPGDVQPKATGEDTVEENGPSSNRQPDEDGFTDLRGGRGRGRGFRGERGSYRSRGERGGFRGERGFRGGERGGFRGERGGHHGERGGHHGERGGHRGPDRFHGGERGGFHGGERGGFHGGERGGFHGNERGGFHGDERGEHGRHRGGERGETQGGERGEFRGGYRGRGEGRGGYRGRGEWRGDGEHRGRRGRGRGFGGDRGGAPAATTPVAAEPTS